jgi:hypothetical protein
MTEMSEALVRAGMQLPSPAENGLMDVAPYRVKSKNVWQEAQKLVNVTRFPAKRTREGKLLRDEISARHSGSEAFTTIKRFHVRRVSDIQEDPSNAVFFGALQRIETWMGQRVEISGEAIRKSSARVAIPGVYAHACEQISNWLGHQIHVGNETEPKYAAHLTIPNLYVGDRVDVTVLEKRLAEGSPDNAAFRGRICTRGIEVGQRYRILSSWMNYRRRLLTKDFPRLH